MNKQAFEMLESVRTCVHDMSLRNAAVKNVLAEAEKHGWERLVASMSNKNRVKLIRMLAESNEQTHAVLETVVGIYEHVIEAIATMTEQELDDIAIQMDDEIERALACAEKRKGTNWLALLTAGGIGYVIGRRA